MARARRQPAAQDDAAEALQPDQLTPLDMLKVLADDTRWHLIMLLRVSDYPVSELVKRLGQPANLISYHLGFLRQAGLVQVHRSDVDARVSYYGLDLQALQSAYSAIGQSFQLAPPAALPPATVVFLCTENSARSQMAEGWLRQLSGGRLTVRSAGTNPQRVHPLTTQVMGEVQIDIGYQHAKGLATLDDIQPDVVVTVCDRAREVCVTLVQAPLQLHWSIPDPVSLSKQGDPLAPFRQVRDQLRVRVAGLLALLPTLGAPGADR